MEGLPISTGKQRRFCAAFAKELGRFKIISQRRASELTSSILFNQFGFNGFTTKITRNSQHYRTMQTPNNFTIDMLVCALFKNYGECGSYAQNQDTGDLMFINDYYGYGTNHATPEQYDDNLRCLKQVFAGTFLWKQVVFPQHLQYPFVTIRGKSFHRGDCMVLTLKNPFGLSKRPSVLPMLRKEGKGKLLLDAKPKINQLWHKSVARHNNSHSLDHARNLCLRFAWLQQKFAQLFPCYIQTVQQ